MTAVRRLIARVTLRTKLVVALLLLVAVGLIASGVVAATALRGYLVARVDDQLKQVSQSFYRQGGVPPPGDPDGGAGFDRRGPSQFYVGVVDATGVVTSIRDQQFGVTQSAPELPPASSLSSAEKRGRPFTVSAVRNDGSWRAVLAPAADGSTLLVAQSLSDVDHTVSRLESLELMIGLAVLVVLAAVGSVVVRRSLRPLAEVEDTAEAIAGGDLSRRVPEVDPRTEVGRLSAALNGMLAQIEHAFGEQRASEASARRSESKMRQFVADASHELRTPLTSIRGFAELFRQGALDDEQELRRALGRIESEAKRMGVLVDDLLLLARLDQQRPLEQQPVDLLVLAKDAVQDATVLAPDRAVGLEASAGSAPLVIGDELRLRQVLGNLLGNALQHTPAGTPVTVRVRTEDDAGGAWAALEVADHGPGLTPEQSEHVFERFYRVDRARTREGEGGAGLGLSIVAGIAAAHGGRAEVVTTPGGGATFRVRLPLATG
ncbi:MAG TPA: HAMP domain-containing sensor histidine kinase [Mycobacteriales bacterium]|jgi:two-component system OmpR family sensor kinase|nr:HAMP domain-containing sensor histidine kinase [Mycobacteriales bacterium]